MPDSPGGPPLGTGGKLLLAGLGLAVLSPFVAVATKGDGANIGAGLLTLLGLVVIAVGVLFMIRDREP